MGPAALREPQRTHLAVLRRSRSQIVYRPRAKLDQTIKYSDCLRVPRGANARAPGASMFSNPRQPQSCDSRQFVPEKS